jgi:hypothetical protein
MRNDVQSVGRDSNGDPDAPDLCFFCRKTVERGGTPPAYRRDADVDDSRDFAEWAAAQVVHGELEDQ